MVVASASSASSLTARRSLVAAAAPASSVVAPRDLNKATFTAAPTQPPVQLYGLSARYANAVYSAAVKDKALAEVTKDLRTIAGWLKESASFRSFVSDPASNRDARQQKLAKISKGMHKYTIGLLDVLNANNRLNELPGVISTFARIIDAVGGVVKCTVTSAEPLSEADLKSVSGEVKNAFLKANQTLDVSVKVNPQIIGGLQVQVGDLFVDLSVASKITNIEKSIAAPISAAEKKA